MPASAFLPSADFSFLSRTYRPTRQEVDTYAELIAVAEGPDMESPEARWHEAELQLWLWRAETRQRTARKAGRFRPAH